MNEIPPAAIFYLVFLALIAYLSLTLIAMDFALWSVGAKTMSGWLRSHPLWFAVPVLFLLILLAGLTVHLLRR